MNKLLTVEDVAKICHEINRAYCIAFGDKSQLPWDEAPEWQKYSAIDGVLFHLKNPHAGSESSHDNWVKQKLVDGWSYGLEKDAENKRHPCIVPFDQLPPEQKAKDYLFRQVVHSLRDYTQFWEDM